MLVLYHKVDAEPTGNNMAPLAFIHNGHVAFNRAGIMSEAHRRAAAHRASYPHKSYARCLAYGLRSAHADARSDYGAGYDLLRFERMSETARVIATNIAVIEAAEHPSPREIADLLSYRALQRMAA